MKHRAEFFERRVKTGIVDGVVFDGREYTGADAVGKLCRELKAGTLEIYRGDLLCMTFDIEKRAKRSLTESPSCGLRYADYKAFVKW